MLRLRKKKQLELKKTTLKQKLEDIQNDHINPRQHNYKNFYYQQHFTKKRKMLQKKIFEFHKFYQIRLCFTKLRLKIYSETYCRILFFIKKNMLPKKIQNVAKEYFQNFIKI